MTRSSFLIRRFQGTFNAKSETLSVYMYDDGIGPQRMYVYSRADNTVLLIEYIDISVFPTTAKIFGRKREITSYDIEDIFGVVNPNMLDEKEFWAVFDEYCEKIGAEDNWNYVWK